MGSEDTLGAYWRALRQRAGYRSSTEVAEKIDRHAKTVERWELNRSHPDAGDIAKLCELYHVTPNEFFRWPVVADVALEPVDGASAVGIGVVQWTYSSETGYAWQHTGRSFPIDIGILRAHALPIDQLAAVNDEGLDVGTGWRRGDVYIVRRLEERQVLIQPDQLYVFAVGAAQFTRRIGANVKHGHFEIKREDGTMDTVIESLEQLRFLGVVKLLLSDPSK